MTFQRLAVSMVPAIALALGITGGAQAAPVNLVTNGDFDDSSPGDKVYFAGNVPGWSGGAGLTFLAPPGTADNGSYLSVYGPFPIQSPTGGNFILADGDPSYSGAFSQTINGLTAGQSYEVSFYQAAGQQAGFTGPTTEQWSVSLGSQTQVSSLFSLPQGGVGPWEKQTLTFTAEGTSSVLTFLAVGTPGGAPPISFLDGVSLTAVPEPATLVLLGSGLLGVGAFRRLRRSKAASV